MFWPLLTKQVVNEFQSAEVVKHHIRRMSRLIAAVAILFASTGGRTQAEHYALLVGCTRYVNLPKECQLEGAGNDVVLMRRLLCDRFGFRDRNITVLAEEGGEGLPTRANIRKQFAQLAEVAGPDDFVVILLAGHGSRQPVPPDNDPAKNYEPDGMDEVFCPRDVGDIEANRSGRIAGGIVDNEIHDWLQAILAKKAFVWIIFDACHSATMIRGNDTERVRAVPPEVLLPGEKLAEAKSRPSKPLPEDTARSVADATENQERLVALYACQIHECEPEKRFSDDTGGSGYHGLLTYALARVLTVSRTPLTYRELVQQIHSFYVSLSRGEPTPMLEGPGQNRLVLDNNSAARRPLIRLTTDAFGRRRIDAGAVHGLCRGSIMAVFPPPGSQNPRERLGHVKVTRLGIPESFVEPTEFDSMPRVDTLPASGQCEVVLADAGLERLRFIVDDRDSSGKPIGASEHKRWSEELGRLVANDPRSLLRQVDDRRQADWLVRFDAGQVLLVPGSGWPSAAGRAGPPSFVPGGKWTDPAEGVRASLENVARAVNLVRLASQDPASVQSQFGECLDVGMTIVVLADKYDPHGKPLAWQKQGLLVPSGTLVRLTLENRERCEVDVTLLYVDSQFGISPIFPVNGQFNRLLANERHSLAPGKIVSDRGGLEHFVLLAAPAQPQIPPVDFSFLEQPSLQEASQGAGARGGLREMRGGGSSLERLLETAIDGREQTRAPKPRKPKEYSMRVISIQVASKTP